MKKTLFGILLLSPLAASAQSLCTGETFKGAIVQVTINTVGSMGAVQDGRVDIQDENGKKTSYAIRKDFIPQYYDHLEGANAERALVFLDAYVDSLNPVSVRYMGTNFENPLKSLVDTNRKKEPNNEMRIWKGPGFDGTQQYQFTDVVCSVSSDI
jgi:hypothetical protein